MVGGDIEVVLVRVFSVNLGFEVILASSRDRRSGSLGSGERKAEERGEREEGGGKLHGGE